MNIKQVKLQTQKSFSGVWRSYSVTERPTKVILGGVTSVGDVDGDNDVVMVVVVVMMVAVVVVIVVVVVVVIVVVAVVVMVVVVVVVMVVVLSYTMVVSSAPACMDKEDEVQACNGQTDLSPVIHVERLLVTCASFRRALLNSV